MESIIYAIILLLSLIGLTEIIKFSIKNFFAINETCKEASLVFLSGENAEFCLINIRRQYNTMNKNKKQIIAVDCGLTQEMKNICQIYCDSHKDITLVGKDTLVRLINTL